MARKSLTTRMPNLAMMTSGAPYVARFAGIRPTAMERQHGRLMRAPDHDAGGGGDAPAVVEAAPAADASPPADAPAAPTPSGEAPASDADTSLLGGALKVEPPADAPEGEAPADAAVPEHVVPEAYDLTIEGLDLDTAAIEEATPVFKEVGLSNEQANKLMPAAAKFRDSVANATMQSIVDAGAAQRAAWADATRSDPDIGGAKLEETLHLSAKALDYLGYPDGSDFRQALTETGFGNHPEMARMMRKVGEMISEDGFPRSDAGSSNLSAKDILYGKKGA